jgi:hypothetical protein
MDSLAGNIAGKGLKKSQSENRLIESLEMVGQIGNSAFEKK